MKDFRTFAGDVRGNGTAGLVVNNKDDAGIKGNDGPKFVGDKCDGVVKVQRRADCLCNLMKRKYFSLRLRDRSKPSVVIVRCAQLVRREAGIRFRFR